MNRIYRNYRFDDGTAYQAEAGKDGVTEKDMHNLKNLINSQYKIKKKMDKLDTISIDTSNSDEDKNIEIVDTTIDIEFAIEINESNTELHIAIAKLSSDQQNLIYKVFFEGVSARNYALQIGMSHTAVNKKLNKILSELKKYLEY